MRSSKTNSNKERKNSSDKRYIGHVIKNARKDKRMTQEKLGIKTDLSRSFICDVENGRYMPSSINLIRICRVLELDLNEILL